eukprot:9539763-Lingulodinium_polyedra.AAC.1
MDCWPARPCLHWYRPAMVSCWHGEPPAMMSSAPCSTSPRNSRRMRAPFRSSSHMLCTSRLCRSVNASLARLPRRARAACASVGSSSAKPLATSAPVASIRRKRSSRPSRTIPVPSNSERRAIARGVL